MIITPVAATLDEKAAPLLMRVGQIVARYGLVVVLAWIGFGKYVKMEARVLIELATHAAGLPVLSAQPGQFLLKDLVLIGVSIWTLGDSLRCAGPSRAVTEPT